MPQAHVLRMTHVGLGRQHLDKVQVALEAADSRVHLLDLSSKSTCSLNFCLGFYSAFCCLELLSA